MKRGPVAIFGCGSLIASIALTMCGCSRTHGGKPETPKEWRDDFEKLDLGKWIRVKGSARTTNGWLALTSTGPQGGAEVQSKPIFMFRTLEARATSANWSGDTSLGFEIWDRNVHRAIVVTNGALGVIDQSKPQPNEWYKEIPEWDTIKSGPHLFKLAREKDRIGLDIDGKTALAYEGPLVPDGPLKVRLNASNDYEDQLRVDYVSVK